MRAARDVPGRGSRDEPDAVRSTATGRRSLDAVLFAALAWVLVAGADGLRVYHRVTPTRIRVERIDADGLRRPLEPPASLAGVGHGPRHTRRRLEAFLASPEGRAWARRAAPEGRLAWTIEFSRDSLRFDRRDGPIEHAP